MWMTLRMFGASARDLVIGPWRLLPSGERRVARPAIIGGFAAGIALGAILVRF